LPANSGAIAGTVAHKHSAPSGDGGELTETITNFSGGNLGEVLTASATPIPIWAAASAGNYALLDSETLGADASEINLTFTTLNAAEISAVAFVFSGVIASDAYFDVDGLGAGSSNWDFLVTTNASGTITGNSVASDHSIGWYDNTAMGNGGANDSPVWLNGIITPAETGLASYQNTRVIMFGSGNTGNRQCSGWYNNGTQNTISSVRLWTAGNSIKDGSKFSCYKITV